METATGNNKVRTDSNLQDFHDLLTPGNEPQQQQTQLIRGPADIQDLLVIKEEPSPEWSSGLESRDSDPLQVKEEQEELLISYETEELNGLKGRDNNRFPDSSVSVKSEDDEEKPRSSQLHPNETEDVGISPEGEQLEDDITKLLFTVVTVDCDHEEKPQTLLFNQTEEQKEAELPDGNSTTQIKTEADGDDGGGSEPAGEQHLDGLHQTAAEEPDSDSCETDGSDDWQEPLTDSGSGAEDTDRSWKETAAAESDGNTLKYKESFETVVGNNCGRKTFICLNCGKTYQYKKSFMRHTCHSGKDSSSSLADSQTTDHNREQPFSCHVCGKKYSQHTTLKRHMKVHTGSERFSCDICGKRFNLWQRFKTHTRSHSGQKPYGCDLCGKRFNQSQHLKAHVSVHTGVKPYGCDVCGKRFNQKAHLKAHASIHTGEKPYSCDVCGKTFREKTVVNVHMKIHTGEKPYVCDVCGKSFSQRSKVNTHMKVHTDEKPYQCDVCGKTFRAKNIVNKHMKVHTGEKPHACDVCGKRFREKNKVGKHMKVHTGEKPFSCDVCGKRFNQRANLQRHVRIHTGEKPYGCDVCGTRFKQRSHLNLHMRIHRGQISCKPVMCVGTDLTGSQNSRVT